MAIRVSGLQHLPYHQPTNHGMSKEKSAGTEAAKHGSLVVSLLHPEEPMQNERELWRIVVDLSHKPQRGRKKAK